MTETPVREHPTRSSSRWDRGRARYRNIQLLSQIGDVRIGDRLE